MYSWSHSVALERKGIGPFSTETLSAFRNGTCMNCGLPVNDVSLFGNSLVVELKHVAVRCRRCRGGGETPGHVYQSFGKMKVSSAICQIQRRKDAYSGRPLDWHKVLICLRKGYAFFQKSYHRPREAFITKPAKNYFGNLLAIGNCGECGAFWTNDFHKMKLQDAYDGNKQWNDTYCWHCHLNHDLQWHMRSSLEEERRLLFGASQDA